MLTYECESRADPDVAWALLARPRRWREWAPQLRGAWGLGEPEVRAGARGAARLAGVVLVPATITRTVEGRLWSWRVGPVELDHRIEPRAGGGCVVGVDLRARAPLEALLRLTYGPVVAVLVRSLARVAEEEGALRS